ncbi:MAG: regulatory protein GemA [Paracoccus sp. (in: a-proteobacteria)]
MKKVEQTFCLGLFEYMGFRPMQAQGQNFGKRDGMASFAQIELIRALWREYTQRRYEGENQLNKWLERCFKVSSLRFLSAEAARKAITALKAMKTRAA